MKDICASILLRSSASTYEMIRDELGDLLPALSTLQRHISKRSYGVEEGMEASNLDRVLEKLREDYSARECKDVIIAEDATTVSPGLQHMKGTRRILGLSHHPSEDSKDPQNAAAQLFDNLQMLKDIIAKASVGTLATHVYIYVVVFPFAPKVPPVTVAFFATNNRFNAEQVEANWTTLRNALARKGFNVLGHATDGDVRPLKAMLKTRDRTFEVSEESISCNDYEAKDVVC